ncbi:hypothetical protein PTD2_20477 [Pseudoalteromonas tunicata D2]|uniref:Uncharacterized protein n=1 Tax=Pseudoalteromonas tunicata D2 TaxID=87626 RepID=A4CA21_9GAMM|nr:hypothetical protein PTD2_20477 [Pseudoalteromonas tunicata D2]
MLPLKIVNKKTTTQIVTAIGYVDESLIQLLFFKNRMKLALIYLDKSFYTNVYRIFIITKHKIMFLLKALFTTDSTLIPEMQCNCHDLALLLMLQTLF